MKYGSGQFAAEAQILCAGGGLDKSISLRRCQKIYDGLHANHYGTIEGLLELEAGFTADFAAVRRRAEGKSLRDGHRNRFIAGNIFTDAGFAVQFSLMRCRRSYGKFCTGEASVFV